MTYPNRLMHHQRIPRDVLSQAVKNAPRGAFRYASFDFAKEQLPPAMMALVVEVAASHRRACSAWEPHLGWRHTYGLVAPFKTDTLVSYHWGTVMPSKSPFGNSDWHKDGKGHAAERHTLLVARGLSWPLAVDSDATTMFRHWDRHWDGWSAIGIVAGEPATYPGSMEHRMIQVPVEHDRLVIRVSTTWMRVRDQWTAWEE